MEENHHAPAKRKMFKEYLLEGLMIFVAVSMGFITENIFVNITLLNQKMIRLTTLLLLWSITGNSLLGQPLNDEEKVPAGFTKLFNGLDFSNWSLPVGDSNHWKILNNVIDYDGESKAKGDKNLWMTKSFRNFILYIDGILRRTWQKK